MTAKTVAGAHILCYINGNLYGRVSNITYNSQTIHRPVYGVDQAEPFELSPSQTKITGTLSVYRLHGDGGSQGAGMSAKYEDIPRGRYFNITLLDRSNDLILFQAKYCVQQSESWSIPAKGIVTGSLNFEAVEFVNESK